jgi:hypothetical protein
MTKRRRDRKRRSARQVAFRQPKRLILIVCEGAVTEVQYFRGYERTLRASLVQIEVSKEHGAPKTLVRTARNRKIEAEELARQQKDAHLQYDEVWCVFDVDEHPGINDATQMARASGIELAVSNPCFELWLLLHFREQPGAQDRHRIQAMLRSHVREYDKSIDFEKFRPHCEDAMKRAHSLDRLAVEVNEPGRNPTTGVYRLLRKINHKTQEQ